MHTTVLAAPLLQGPLPRALPRALLGLSLGAACTSAPIGSNHTLLEPRSPPDFVYVLSVAAFADSDADGVGDLQGVRAHVEHIRSLGVRTVQFTPVQPGWDAGRTVPVGPGVDPLLGSAADLAMLAADLHALGISLEVQLPMGAIGRSHRWFQEALHGEGRIELGVLGGPGWCPTGDMRQYYASGGCGRPDLDWDHVGLAGDVAAEARTLLDAGLDGVVFRPFFADGARDGVEVATATLGELDGMRPGVTASVSPDELVVEALRRWMAVGPVADLPRAMAVDAAVRDRELGWVHDVLLDWGPEVVLTRPFLADYDGSRLASRVSDAGVRRTLTVLHLLGPGQPTLYYGEELDLRDATTLPVDSPWRAPMPWTDGWNCGFSTGEPWFEPDPACKVGWNVDDEAEDPTSMLTLVRWLAEVRAAWGDSLATVLSSGFEDVMVFRTGDLLVAGSVSLTDRAVQIVGLDGQDLTTGGPVRDALDVPAGGWRVVRVWR